MILTCSLASSASTTTCVATLLRPGGMLAMVLNTSPPYCTRPPNTHSLTYKSNQKPKYPDPSHLFPGFLSVHHHLRRHPAAAMLAIVLSTRPPYCTSASVRGPADA